jgi:hypothetical protein
MKRAFTFKNTMTVLKSFHKYSIIVGASYGGLIGLYETNKRTRDAGAFVLNGICGSFVGAVIGYVPPVAIYVLGKYLIKLNGEHFSEKKD